MQLALDMKTGEQVAIKFLERTGRKMKTKHILRCATRSMHSSGTSRSAVGP